MECVSIQSRLIASAAYYRRDGKLCVWFNSGRCAWHYDVSEAMFQNLAKAESAGLYYFNYIATSKRPPAHKKPLARGKASAIPRLAAFALLSMLMLGLSNAIPYSGTEQAALAKSDFRYGADPGAHRPR